MFKLIQSLNANRSHFETITIDLLIEKIKSPSIAVENARAAGKKINRTAYDQIKQTTIEAYHPNELDGVSTGFIYLDVDDFDSTEDAVAYRQQIINKFPDLITLCWLSVSNLGLSILIKVENLTKSNYNEYWDVLNQLFDCKLDKNSRGFSKVNCISFDPSVYINLDSISFEEFKGGAVVGYFPLNLITNYCTPPDELETNNSHNNQPLHPPLISIRYQTGLDDSAFQNINTPVIIPEGMKILRINARYFLKNRIKVGNRNKVLSALSMQLIVLNPLPAGYSEKVLRGQLLNALLHINKNYVVEPLTKDEVIKIFNPNYKKYKQQGYLDVNKYLNETRFVFWHSECQIPAYDRVSIGLKLLNTSRRRGKEYNQQLIHDAIEMLQDGNNPITRRTIMEVTGLKEDSVKRYWKPFKAIIDEYNTTISGNPVKVTTPTMTGAPAPEVAAPPVSEAQSIAPLAGSVETPVYESTTTAVLDTILSSESTVTKFNDLPFNIKLELLEQSFPCLEYIDTVKIISIVANRQAGKMNPMAT